MAERKIVQAILCGGGGTRLWPLSRTREPKQFQILFGDGSLFEHTAKRVIGVPGATAPVVICRRNYSDQIEDKMTRNNIPIGAIIEEPVGRDTAAAAALAAHWIVKNHGEDAILVLLPADHYVADVDGFREAIVSAATLAEQSYVATIGIKPHYPETGYGYIRRTETSLGETGAYVVDKFVEKPDALTAETYLKAGNFFWNAGIFAIRAGYYLEELERFEPLISALTAQAYDAAVFRRNSDGSDRVRLQLESFALIPKKSIDYAVMEKTERMAVQPAAFGWSDVGNWSSVHDLSETDDQNNALTGNVVMVESKNCLVKADERAVALAGVENLIVIDTPDALLVCAKDQTQLVRTVHKHLEENQESSVVTHGLRAENYETQLRSWAKRWLFETALPLWASAGQDPLHGGVFEALDANLLPRTDLPKRFRVQARQVYTFAHAYHLGWDGGQDAMAAPLDFMLQHCWSDDGGWAHLFERDGSVIDGGIDAYDQAFGLLALCWAYKTTGESILVDKAKATVAAIRARLTHPAGGFSEGIPARTARRANPHMHLFEAAMHWMTEHHTVPAMAELADEIFDLYSKYFCIDGLLREYFNDDLSVISNVDDPTLLMVEPGHLIEWAFLLRQYASLTGKSSPTISTLEAFSDVYGLNPNTGLVVDHCYVDGRAADTVTSRLWPQTEYARLKLTNGSAGGRLKGLEMIARLRDNYLTIDGKIRGHWCDRLDGDGKIIDARAPASSFYHILGCIEPLIKG